MRAVTESAPSRRFRRFFGTASGPLRDSRGLSARSSVRMSRLASATLALLLGAVPQTGPAAGDRRLAVQVEGSRRVEVFRAIPVYRGLVHEVEIAGTGVEAASRVEAGRGLDVPPGGVRRAAGSVRVTLHVDPGAPLGPSDLRLRFPNEPAGPEVFPVVVLRNGRVTSVEPRRVETGKKVVLAFSGTEIGDGAVLAHHAYAGARVLPGGTETRCEVELAFTRPGVFEIPLFDRSGLPRPGSRLDDPGGYERGPAARVEVVSPR